MKKTDIADSFVDFPKLSKEMIQENHIYLYINRGSYTVELIVCGTVVNYNVTITAITDRGMKWDGELTEEELCQAEYALMETHEDAHRPSDWMN